MFRISTISARPHQPFYPNRVVNFLSKFKKKRSKDPDQLLSEASKSSGLDDFGDESFIEPMKLFLQPLDTDDQMSPTGRMAAQKLNLKLLIDRLQIQDTLY